MSCHGCAEAFGFWRRELGCPTCKFAYCKKCLRFKVEPAEGGAALTVCFNCYSGQKSLSTDENISASKEWKTASHALRAIQVLEAMDNPSKPPITLYRESSNLRFAKLKKGLSVDDQKLVERLAELSEDSNRGARRKSEQPEDELAARLAKLKGEEVPKSGSHTIDGKSILLTQKPETEIELLERLGKQVELQKNYDTSVVDDIETRLAKLRDQPPSSANQSSVDATSLTPDEEVGDEQQVERIISRYVAEAALQAKHNEGDEGECASDEEAEYHSADSDEDLDFDKLCRICEEKRATIRCEECDGDIFCKGCFKEFHDELGETHKPASIPRSEEH